MELKEGMFVRTKDGYIDEVIIDYEGYCNNPNCNCKHVSCKYNYYDENKIVKASNNIIDLIEVGDYVNGYLVLFAGATTWDNDGNVLDKQVHINHNGYDLWLREEYIKSIVTKEQFESMEYKLEER